MTDNSKKPQTPDPLSREALERENTYAAAFGEHLDSAVRGFANAATFGGADKLAAYTQAHSQGGTYEGHLKEQKQRDHEGGASYVAGELGSIVVPAGVLREGATLVKGAMAGFSSAKAALYTGVTVAGAGEAAVAHAGDAHPAVTPQTGPIQSRTANNANNAK